MNEVPSDLKENDYGNGSCAKSLQQQSKKTFSNHSDFVLFKVGFYQSTFENRVFYF